MKLEVPLILDLTPTVLSGGLTEDSFLKLVYCPVSTPDRRRALYVLWVQISVAVAKVRKSGYFRWLSGKRGSNQMGVLRRTVVFL